MGGNEEQYKDFWERVIGHVTTWLNRNNIFSYEKISLYRYEYPDEETDKHLFYATSCEFVRYLIMRYGESTIWEIIQEVGKGASYDKAFINAIGSNEKELYEAWLIEWF